MTKSRYCADLIVLDSIAAKAGDARLSTLDVARTPTDPFSRSKMTSPMGSASWLDMCIKQIKVDFEIRSWLEKKHKQIKFATTVHVTS